MNFTSENNQYECELSIVGQIIKLKVTKIIGDGRLFDLSDSFGTLIDELLRTHFINITNNGEVIDGELIESRWTLSIKVNNDMLEDIIGIYNDLLISILPKTLSK